MKKRKSKLTPLEKRLVTMKAVRKKAAIIVGAKRRMRK